MSDTSQTVTYASAAAILQDYGWSHLANNTYGYTQTTAANGTQPWADYPNVSSPFRPEPAIEEAMRHLLERGAPSSAPKSTPKENQPVKTLFNVIVVTKKEEIILDAKVVAEDANEAQFLVDVAAKLKEKSLKPKDVTILCNSLGQVKVEKEVEKVRLVKDEE